MSSELDSIAQNVFAQRGYRITLIGGDSYAVKLLPAGRGMALSMNLIKLFLPSIATWADGVKREDFVMPEDVNVFSDAAILLVGQLDQFDIEGTISALMEGLMCNNEAVDWNDAFRGRYTELVEILEFSLKENFGDFFTNYLRKKGIDLTELSQGFADLVTPESNSQTEESSPT